MNMVCAETVFRDPSLFRDPSFSSNRSHQIHRWVPWIAGFSKDFVKDALTGFATGKGKILDPFAGVGTTLVEADIAGHAAVGFEINPYASFVTQTKLGAYRINPDDLHAIVESYNAFMHQAEIHASCAISSAPHAFRTRSPFYSKKVERKVLLTQDFIAAQSAPIAAVFGLAFASLMVKFSNYSYEPSLGRKASAGRPDVDDYDVSAALIEKLRQIGSDAEWYRENRVDRRRRSGRVLNKSFFDGYTDIEKSSVDVLITSPPYLNNYHYNRNTRPHLYWLGFCKAPDDLKRLEELNFGTYWQNARGQKTVNLDADIDIAIIHEAISEVRNRNPEKGIYGGNGWANYAARYFNDCARFIRGADWCLRPGGTALVVIGNSILQGVHIPTDVFLGEIAERLGLDLVNIHTPRTARVGNSIVDSSVRAGSSNGQNLYESVVELRRP